MSENIVIAMQCSFWILKYIIYIFRNIISCIRWFVTEVCVRIIVIATEAYGTYNLKCVIYIQGYRDIITPKLIGYFDIRYYVVFSLKLISDNLKLPHFHFQKSSSYGQSSQPKQSIN